MCCRARQGKIPGDLNPSMVPAEYGKDGEDWFALYNPRVTHSLNVSFVHQLNHKSLVCCVCFSKDGMWLTTGCHCIAPPRYSICVPARLAARSTTTMPPRKPRWSAKIERMIWYSDNSSSQGYWRIGVNAKNGLGPGDSPGHAEVPRLSIISGFVFFFTRLIHVHSRDTGPGRSRQFIYLTSDHRRMSTSPPPQSPMQVGHPNHPQGILRGGELGMADLSRPFRTLPTEHKIQCMSSLKRDRKGNLAWRHRER